MSADGGGGSPGGGAPADFIAGGTYGSGFLVNSLNVALPTADDGSIMMLFACGNNQNSTINNPPTIDGWDYIDGSIGPNDTASDLWTYAHVKQTGDPNPLPVTASDGGASKQFLGAYWAAAFSGDALEVDTFKFVSIVNNASLTVGSITTEASGKVFCMVVVESNGTVATSSPGWIEVAHWTETPNLNWVSYLFTAGYLDPGVTPALSLSHGGGSVTWAASLFNIQGSEAP